MKKNVGKTDRVIRVVLGLVLIPLALEWRYWLIGIVGVALIFSGLVGWCGLYKVFGFSTCKNKNSK